MSLLRNSNIPNKFFSHDIDTSNWPAQHNFIANLPDDVESFTEGDWLNLVLPSDQAGGDQNNVNNKYDDFLEIRRTLNGLQLLADYNNTRTNSQLNTIANNLKNNNSVKPIVAVLLGKTFLQLEADINSNGSTGAVETGRMYPFITQGITDVNVGKSLVVAFSNVMLCCFSELIAKEGITYSQADAYYGTVSIANFIYPMLTGQLELKEFKLYLLIKSFYFDSKFYKFISPIKEFETISYRGTTIRNAPIYEENKLLPSHIFRLFIIEIWLKNKKATIYNNLENRNMAANPGRQPEKFGPLAKFGFMLAFFEVLKGETIATQIGSLGANGSIKLILANYLILKDPIYLFSAAISVFTNPSNGIPGFDEMATTIQTASGIDFLDDRYPIQGILLNFATWKQQSNEPRTNLDTYYIEKLYKRLTKLVDYKNKKITTFMKKIHNFNKRVFKPVTNFTPKQIRKLANANTPELWNRNNTGPRGQIQRLGFLLRPIKKGWSDNNPPNKILTGGAKKNKNKNKTLKKHNTYKKKKRNITINKK